MQKKHEKDLEVLKDEMALAMARGMHIPIISVPKLFYYQITRNSKPNYNPSIRT